MATVASINREGEVKIEGTVSERMPVFTDGLVCHYPFDGTLNPSYSIVSYEEDNRKISSCGLYAQSENKPGMPFDYLMVYNNYENKVSHKKEVLSETFNEMKIERFKITCHDYTPLNVIKDHNYQGIGIKTSQKIFFKKGLTYSVSFYFRPISDSSISVSGLPTNIKIWNSTYYSKIEGTDWYYCRRSSIEITEDNQDWIFFGMRNPEALLNQENVFDIAGFKIEEGSYYNSDNESFSTQKRITLPDLENMTIVGTFQGFDSNNKFKLSKGNRHDLFRVQNKINNENYVAYSYWYDKGIGKSSPFLAVKGSFAQGYAGHYHIHKEYEIDSSPHVFVFTKTKEEIRIRIFNSDGTFINHNQGRNYDANSFLNEIVIGEKSELNINEFNNNWPAWIRDLSVYDYAFNDEEASRFVKKIPMFNQQGSIKTKNIKEKLDDGFHLSLMNNDLSFSELIDPVFYGDAASEKGHYVLKERTNHFKDPWLINYNSGNTQVTSMQGWIIDGSGENYRRYWSYVTRQKWTQESFGNKGYCFRAALSSESDRAFLLSQRPAVKNGRVISCIAKKTNGEPGVEKEILPAFRQTLIGKSAESSASPKEWDRVEEIGNSGWYRLSRKIEISYTDEEITDSNNRVTGFTVRPGGDVLIAHVQLEDGYEPTPPMEYRTEDTSPLMYNLHRDIGLDWSKDFTIGFWKKALNRNNDIPNKYNISSIGKSEIGSYYLWFGKIVNNNSLSFNSHIDNVSNKWKEEVPYKTTYDTEWRFIVLRKTGDIFKTIEYDHTGNKYELSNTLIVDRPDAFVSSEGWDLNISGYSTTIGNIPCDNIVRNLFVYKRSLSDTEIDTLYKKKFAFNLKELYLSHQVIE